MKISDSINLEDLDNRMEGDMDLFRELADIFIDDVNNLLGNIEISLKNKDASRLTKAAHTLKGAVSNFSAEKTFHAAQMLERAGKDNRMSEAEEVFKTVRIETENLLVCLKMLKSSPDFKHS